MPAGRHHCQVLQRLPEGREEERGWVAESCFVSGDWYDERHHLKGVIWVDGWVAWVFSFWKCSRCSRRHARILKAKKVVEAISAKFKLYDKNKDGHLNKAEVIAYSKKAGAWS